MKRYVVVLLLLAAPARAQDIPLSKILVDGEGWKPARQDDPFAASLRKPEKPVARSILWRYEIDEQKNELVGNYSGPETVIRIETTKPTGIHRASGLTVSRDKSTLFGGDAEGKHVWAFRIEEDGKLTGGDRYCALRMKPGEKASGVKALTTDSVGCIYAATPLGVQIFDPTGRL